MQSFKFVPKAIHVVRIDPGEDILEAVSAFAREAGIGQAAVVGGYGTLSAHSLHWVAHNRLPCENRFDKGEGGIEVLSMNGLLVKGEPHIHVVLSTERGAYGGHMEPGCKAYVLCEVFLAEIAGGELQRDSIQVDIPGMGKGTISRLTMSSRAKQRRLPGTGA